MLYWQFRQYSTFYLYDIYLQNFTQKSDSFQPFGQALKRLVTVSSMCYHTSTSALSTSYSSRVFTPLKGWDISSWGDFTLRCLQRLFLPDLATGDAIGMTAGTPVVRPARSSRTKASSPQISYARRRIGPNCLTTSEPSCVPL